MLITHPSRRPRLPSALLLSTLLLGSPVALMGQDVEFIVLLKEQHYGQYEEHIVALLDEDSDDIYLAPYFSEISVETPDPSQITSITATLLPSGPPILVLAENEDSDGFDAEAGYELLAEMNAAIPNGSYRFDFETVNDGTNDVTLDLTGDDYPSLRKFTGFAATQSIDATSAKTFNWESDSIGLASDWVFFEIEEENGNTLFESAEPGEAGALDGTSTSITVPGGLLSDGTTYLATLFIIRPVDINEDDYTAGVTAVAAYGKSIQMEIRTTGNSGEFDVPFLDHVAPHYGQGEVESNSIVTFVFDEPMNTSVNESQAITWTGVANPALFQYTWSPDGHRLFCNYAPGLPADATITWYLNPLGSATKLRDVEGNELNSEQFFGDFFTKALPSNLGVDDLKRIELLRGRYYEQNGVGSATLLDYFAEISVSLNGISTMSSMDLLTPGLGTSTNLGEFEFDHFDIDGEALFAEETDLDYIFPNGIYNLTVHTFHDGVQMVNLDLDSSAYPTIPVIQNFAATQAWDSTQPLNVQWNPMGGTSGDLIVLFIESDNACFFETPEIGVVGALDGTAISVTIPANTLPPGRTLEGGLAFVKVLTNDTSQYPGVISASGLGSVTEFQIQTIGDPVEPILNIVHDGDAATLSITAEKGRVYQVNSSPDLEIWTPEDWIWIDGDYSSFLGTNEYYDYNGVGIPSRYFQLEDVSEE